MKIRAFTMLCCLLITVAGNTDEPAVTPSNVSAYTVSIATELQTEFPDAPEAHFALGYANQAALKFEAAVEAFQAGLKLAPDNVDALIAVAESYNRLHQFEKTVEWFHKALEVNPSVPRLNHKLGLTLIRLNRSKEALEAFRREVELNPKNGAAYFYLAERYFEEGDLEEAEQYAQETSKIDNRFSEPYFLLSKIYRKQGDQEKTKAALESFRKQKELESRLIETIEEPSPQDEAVATAVQIHNIAGVVYYKNRKDRKAEEHFKKSIHLNPKEQEARVNLSYIYQDQAQFQKAEQVLRELIRINPDDPTYPAGLAMTLAAQKKWDEALTMFPIAVQKSPNSASVKHGYAQALIDARKDAALALALMQDVTNTDPTAERFDLLSRCYFIHGDFQNSLAAMQQAITMEPDNPVYKMRYEKLLQRR